MSCASGDLSTMNALLRIMRNAIDSVSSSSNYLTDLCQEKYPFSLFWSFFLRGTGHWLNDPLAIWLRQKSDGWTRVTGLEPKKHCPN